MSIPGYTATLLLPCQGGEASSHRGWAPRPHQHRVLLPALSPLRARREPPLLHIYSLKNHLRCLPPPPKAFPAELPGPLPAPSRQVPAPCGPPGPCPNDRAQAAALAPRPARLPGEPGAAQASPPPPRYLRSGRWGPAGPWLGGRRRRGLLRAGTATPRAERRERPGRAAASSASS